MDALSQLFTHFRFRTDLFFLGRLCNTSTHAESEKGYLHLVREGRCLLQIPDTPPIRIEEPTLIFMSGHMQHTITPLDPGAGAAQFHHVYSGKATVEVPRWVDSMLN